MTRMETGSEAHVPAERQEAGEAPRLPGADVDPGWSGRPALPPTEGPLPPVGLTWRLRGGRDLDAVARRGRRASAGVIRLRHLPGVAGQPPTVAYAVGRPVGTAVVRNRVRRRLRAQVATLAAEGALAPGSYLIAAHPPAAARTSAELGRDLRAALAGLPVPLPA